jgi:hypothetical protein
LTGHHRATVTLAALVIANLIPVFGVLQLDWDVGAIVVLYWCENLVIGCYTIVKLFMAAGAGALLSMLFFMVHYGGFCGIHGVFVLSLTGFAGDEPGSMDIMPEGTWPGPLEYVGLKTGRIMTAPYGRILVLHIAIIAGGFLVITLGSPVGLLLALVALKIGMDIMLHRRSHRRTAKPAAAAATDSAAPPRQDTGTGEN